MATAMTRIMLCVGVLLCASLAVADTSYDFAVFVKNCKNYDDTYFLREKLSVSGERVPPTISIKFEDAKRTLTAPKGAAPESIVCTFSNKQCVDNGRLVYTIDGKDESLLLFEPTVYLSDLALNSFPGCAVQARDQAKRPLAPSAYKALEGLYDFASEVSPGGACHLVVKDKFEAWLDDGQKHGDIATSWALETKDSDKIYIQVGFHSGSDHMTCTVEPSSEPQMTHQCYTGDAANKVVQFYFDIKQPAVLKAKLPKPDCAAYHTRHHNADSADKLAGTYKVTGVTNCDNEDVKFSDNFLGKYFMHETTVAQNIVLAADKDDSHTLTFTSDIDGTVTCADDLDPNLCTSGGRQMFTVADDGSLRTSFVVARSQPAAGTEFSGCQLKRETNHDTSGHGPWLLVVAVLGGIVVVVSVVVLGFLTVLYIRKRSHDDDYNRILNTRH